MKKLASVIAVIGAFAFIACGPSSEQKAAMEKAKADSARTADSLKSVAAANAAKAKQDSIAKAAAAMDTTKKAAEPAKK